MDDQTIVIRINPSDLLLPGLAFISAIFLTIAAFGPWATMVGVTSVSGMDDNGVLILPLAIIAGIGAIAYIVRPATRIWLAGIMLAAFGLAGFLAAVDWITIADEGYAPLRDAEVGWGVQLAAASGAIGALFSFAALMEWALAPDRSGVEEARSTS
jgi:hypothetical protein